MKRSILIGSIFVCFLMLLVPCINAVETNTIKTSIPDYDGEELTQAIIQRIEELKVTNPNPKMEPNYDDPDGPFEGGLDDLTDWIDLVYGFGGIFIFKILHWADILKIILESEGVFNLFMFILYVLETGLCTWIILTGLGDAFDIIDVDDAGRYDEGR